jgi:hypothetical protein
MPTEAAHPETEQAPAAGREPQADQAVERARAARTWIPEVPKSASERAPYLVVDRAGHVFVIERSRRRPVSSSVLAAALEVRFGPPERVEQDRLERWPEGAPVEVLEGRRGAPVLVVGGERLPVRGLPLPYPVRQGVIDRLPQGEAIDLGRALVGRRQYDEVRARATDLAELTSPSGLARRVRRTVAAHGVVGSLSLLVDKVRDRGRRRIHEAFRSKLY